MRRKSKASLESRRSFVLILVLMILAAAATTVVFMLSNSQTQVDAVEKFKDSMKAYHGALSAFEIGRAFLKEGKSWNQSVSYTYSGLSLTADAQPICGRLNLNKLNDAFYFRAFERLLEELNLSPKIASNIRSYINETEPHQIRTLGELFYVDGVNATVYRKILPYVTVYTDGKIDINSAPKRVLESLDDEITPQVADAIITARPFSSVAALKNVPEVSQELYFKIEPFLKCGCDCYLLNTTAVSDSSRVTVSGVIRKGEILDRRVEF